MRKKQYVCDALNSAVTPDGATVEVMGVDQEQTTSRAYCVS